MQSKNMSTVESVHLRNWLDSEREELRIALNFPAGAMEDITGHSPR